MSLVRIFFTSPTGIVAESWNEKLRGGWFLGDLSRRCEPFRRTTSSHGGSLVGSTFFGADVARTRSVDYADGSSSQLYGTADSAALDELPAVQVHTTGHMDLAPIASTTT